jgi:ABC-type bacteriocin/lantibiotic exporter with double-glycine peptidase domain
VNRFFSPRVISVLQPHLKFGLFTIVLMLVSALLQLPLPLISARIIDHVFQNRRVSDLGPSLLLMGGFGLFLLIVSFFQSYFNAVFSERSKAQCVAALMDKALEMSSSSFHRRSVGYLMARIKDDVGAIDALLNSLAVALSDSATLLLVTGAVFWLDTRMAVMAALIVPFYAVVVRIFNHQLRSKLIDASEKGALASHEIQEALVSHDLIKTFGAEEYHQKRLNTKIRSMMSARIAAAVVSGWARTAAGFITIVVPVGVLWVGAYEFIHGRLTLGGLFAFNSYLAFMLGSANSLISVNFSFQALRVAIARIGAILEEQDDIPPGRRQTVIEAPKGKVEFQQVTFSYFGQEKCLSDVSFEIKAGEYAALVGESGAGKTTVLALLLRLYWPQNGRILVDDVPLDEIDPRQLRDMIAVVSQETLLVTASIAENIRYNTAAATDDQLREAAAVANAHEFIEGLPQGYQTVIGQDGFNLSVGQRQRISIARAILRKPRILVLDEASSALDNWSEKLIKESIDRLRGTMTIITVAHNLPSIQSADRILLLDQGQLKGQGRHEALYSSCREYARLFDLHFKAGTAAAEGGPVAPIAMTDRKMEE